MRLKRGARGLVVGDFVRIGAGAPEVLPRNTVLERRDPQGRVRAIAANLDVVGITITSQPSSPSGYVDRGIVAARAAGIAPFVVVNKCDLPSARELAEEVRGVYAGGAPEAGVPVFAVSAESGEGLETIRAFFRAGYRGAFIGTSGVGKSSLLNVLVPGVSLDTGELNRMTRQGRHVTTRSTLHVLPDGGELIDTPGFRDFVPVALDATDLAQHFAGFEPGLAEGCRFRDCLHKGEPDCGVAAQIDAGTIAPARHEGYLRILEDIERAAEADRYRKRDR